MIASRRQAAAASSRARALLWAGLALILGLWPAACLGRSREGPLKTLPGPESLDIGRDSDAVVVMDTEAHALIAVSLRTGAEALLIDGGERPSVWFLDGPARDGLLVMVARVGSSAYELRLLDLRTGAQSVVFSRSGDLLWKGCISAPALSRDGGRIAFVRNTSPSYRHRRFSGMLEVWSVEQLSAQKQLREVAAIDGGLDWFDDGIHLALVRLVATSAASPPAAWHAEFNVAFGLDEGVPMIMSFNTRTGATVPLHPGLNPLVSPDGTHMLVQDGASVWWTLDLVQEQAERGAWPGNWRGPVDWVEDDLLFYRGLPTEGAAPRYTRYGSPLVRRHAMGDLKLAELSSGRFRTVTPTVDPRGRASCGRVDGGAEALAVFKR